MAIALVTANNAVATGSSAAPGLTFAGTTTTGNTVLVTLVWFSKTITVTSMHDPHGSAMNTTVSTAPIASNAAWSCQIFWLSNITASASAFAGVLSSTVGWSMWASEFSGTNTSNSADSGNLSAAAYNHGSSTTPASLSVTPSANNAMIYGWMTNAASGVITPVGSTLLKRDTVNTGGSTVYVVQTTATAYTTHGTMTTGVWDAKAFIIAAPSAAAPEFRSRTAYEMGTRAGSRGVWMRDRAIVPATMQEIRHIERTRRAA